MSTLDPSHVAGDKSVTESASPLPVVGPSSPPNRIAKSVAGCGGIVLMESFIEMLHHVLGDKALVIKWRTKHAFDRGNQSDIYIAGAIVEGVYETVVLKVSRRAVPSDELLHLPDSVMEWSKLRHDHVLPLIGVFLNSSIGKLVMVSPFMGNINALSYLRHNPKLDQNERLKLAIQAAKGLAYIHSQLIVHRDIKPINMFIDERGDLCIGDLGSARSIFKMSPPSTGTFRYMPPELSLTDSFNTFEADTWSFGLSILELFTLLPPWHQFRSDAQVCIYFSEAPNCLPLKPDPSIMHDSLWDVLATSCWSTSPSERISMDELVTKLSSLDLSTSISNSESRRISEDSDQEMFSL